MSFLFHFLDYQMKLWSINKLKQGLWCTIWLSYIYIYIYIIYIYEYIYAFNSRLVEEINEDKLADAGYSDDTDTDDEADIDWFDWIC